MNFKRTNKKCKRYKSRQQCKNIDMAKLMGFLRAAYKLTQNPPLWYKFDSWLSNPTCCSLQSVRVPPTLIRVLYTQSANFLTAPQTTSQRHCNAAKRRRSEQKKEKASSIFTLTFTCTLFICPVKLCSASHAHDHTLIRKRSRTTLDLRH